MVAAFADIENVVRNSDNPFFKSSYADLSAVLDTIRPVYARHGLAIMQSPGPIVEVAGQLCVTLTSVVMHASGQHMVFNAQLPMAPQVDKKTGEKSYTPQAGGSALTYLRRYADAALAAIAQVDDDGNAAAGRVAREPDATPEEIIARIEASDSYDDVVKLEEYVKATGDEKVVDAYVTRRKLLKSKKAKA
jgi:hypothetical protein